MNALQDVTQMHTPPQGSNLIMFRPSPGHNAVAQQVPGRQSKTDHKKYHISCHRSQLYSKYSTWGKNLVPPICNYLQEVNRKTTSHVHNVGKQDIGTIFAKQQHGASSALSGYHAYTDHYQGQGQSSRLTATIINIHEPLI